MRKMVLFVGVLNNPTQFKFDSKRPSAFEISYLVFRCQFSVVWCLPGGDGICGWKAAVPELTQLCTGRCGN